MEEERQSMDVSKLREEFKPQTKRNFKIEAKDADQSRKMTATLPLRIPPRKTERKRAVRYLLGAAICQRFY